MSVIFEYIAYITKNNTYMKTNLFNFASIAAAFALSLTMCLSSCKKDQNKPTPTDGKISEAVQKQLHTGFDTWGVMFKNTDVQPVSFSYKGQIATEQDRQSVINTIASDNSYVVSQYDGTTENTLKVNQLSDIKNKLVTASVDEGDTGKPVPENLRAALDTLVKIGQIYVEIHWKSSNKTFTSIAVCDQQNVIYDNMFSNIVTVENTPAIIDAAGLTTMSSSRTATVVNLTIKGIWPLTHRGWVKITHSIYYSGGKIITDGSSADASMTLGSADAKAKSYKRTAAYSQITWAYGWATPTASFKITLNAKSGTFEASVGGIGSAGHGAAIHAMTL